MLATEFIRLRLANQRLSVTTLSTPAQVVRWLGAAQAQEYGGAKWSLALRMQNGSDEVIEQAFTAGEILRTHLMRPTWHFVPAEDIRWMLELTAPRVHTVNGTMYRQHALDTETLVRSSAVLESALGGGRHLTRAELAAELRRAGISADGVRLGYILHYAELEGLICSGPRRGKQFTHALLAERAPQAQSLPREQALATLTRRFFSSHGPATLKDFSWWSGLTMADARIGLEIARSDLLSEEIDGLVYWRPAASPDVEPPSPYAYLLQPYDEYTIAYRHYWPVFDPDHRQQILAAAFYGIIILDGRLVGNWGRTIKGKQTLIKTALFRPLSEPETAALQAAAARFGDFVGMEAVLV